MAEFVKYYDYEIIDSLLDSANWSAVKRDIDTSNTHQYYFWTTGRSILQGIRDVELMSRGFFYIDHRGYAKWESRNYRSIYKTTPSATFNNTMADMVYELSDREIFNEIRIKSRSLEPATDWKRWQWQGSQKIYFNVIYPFYAYPDTDEEVSEWGTPGCYAVTEGYGYDASNEVVITKKQEGERFCYMWVILSGVYQWDYVYLKQLWLDYLPLQPEEQEGTPPAGGWGTSEFAVMVSDDTSIASYGRRVKEISLPFPMDYDEMENLANDYLVYYKDPVPLVKMKLVNKNDTLLEQILTRHISDRIMVVNTEVGINGDFFINKEEHKTSDHGLYHEVWWTLEKVVGSRQIGVWDLTEWDECIWGLG